jgi:hypothetical protein
MCGENSRRENAEVNRKYANIHKSPLKREGQINLQ